MMSKTLKIFIASAIILAAVFAAGYFTAVKTLGPDPAYWIRKDKYLADIAAEKANTAAALAVIGQKDVEISGLNKDLIAKAKEIRDLQKDDAISAAAIASLEDKNKILRTDAAAAIAANPAVRALVENQDAQISEWKKTAFTLRKEVERLGPPIYLGRDPNTGDDLYEYPPDSITFALNAKAEAYHVQAIYWGKIADEKDALLITANGLISDNEKRLSSNRFWKITGWTVAGILGGIEIYHGIRRK